MKNCILLFVMAALFMSCKSSGLGNAGLGAKPVSGSEVIIDGSRKTLDAKWTYWNGPRSNAKLPLKWKIVKDPVDVRGAVISGTLLGD